MHLLPLFGAALTRFDDVRAALFDRSMNVSSLAAKRGAMRANILAQLPKDLRAAPPPLFFMDGDDHRRLRKIIAPAFSQRAVFALRPLVSEIAADLLDGLEGEPSFDLIARYATPLPLHVIGHILGVAPNRRHALRAHSEAIIHELHPLASTEQRNSAIDAHRALIQFFDEEIAFRRREPGSDLLTTLLGAMDRGEVRRDEVISLCINLLVAGHITTTDLIGVTTYLLLSNPGELVRLRQNPELWRNAIEEALRFEPPAPLLARVCPAARRVHDHDLEQGDTLNLFIASANRDPRRFDAPDAFDVTRQSNPHLSFGGGDHFCLGAQLARTEAEIAVSALFARMPKLSLCYGETAWRAHANFHGLTQLLLDNEVSMLTRRQGAVACATG
ncbi:MAG: cytochrome P450 [Pseudomonadota bacterium]